MSDHDHYGSLLGAARWAETNADPYYGLTAPVLYALAADYVAGRLELSALRPSPEDEEPWSGPMTRLRAIGIDVWALAAQRAGH